MEEGWKEIAKLCIEDREVEIEYEGLTFDEYQYKALETSICPEGMDILYPLIGLTGETGEVAEKIKKAYRDKDGELTFEDRLEILKELGDCLWYINKMVYDLGYTLEDCALANLDKCYKRRAEGTLHGNGDNR